MTELSKYNNIGAQLPVGGGFVGRIESTGIYNAITVNILISQPSIVTVYQFPTSQGPLSAYSNIFEQSVTENEQTTFQVPVVSPWFNLVVSNISGVPVNINANTYLQEQTATCVIDAIQAGGGGGNASLWATFPAVANVDLDDYNINNVNNISADIVATDILKTYKEGALGSILVQNSLDMDGKNISGVNNLSTENLSSPNDTGLLISSSQLISLYANNGISISTPQIGKNPANMLYSNLGNLTFTEGEQNLTNALGTTTSKGFTLTQGGGGTLDMNGNDILNANIISSVVDNSLDITADINLNIEAKNNISLITATNATPNIIEYTGLGNLVFYEGQQNITNLLGVTTSKEFTLTQGGGGVITFEDGTTMATAGGGGGGGNFSTPSNQDLDMNGNNITNINLLGAVENQNININSGITFTQNGGSYISNVSNIVGNNVGGSDPYLQIDNLTNIYTPTGAGLQVNVIGGVSFYGGTNLLMGDGEIGGVGQIRFSDTTLQTTAYTGDDVKTITSTDASVTITTPSANTVNLSVAIPPSITSNTFYVNDGVNNINSVLPLMGSGDICIVSAGSFGNTTDITWNVAQSGLSGSVAPAPLSFLTTANASRFTVTATQVRVANIKFQLPVFLSGNNCQLDNCDFDSTLTIGTNVTGYITIQNCEFVGTQTITVASTFGNICYFINTNFLGSTFVLSQASASQVIFNNCSGFVSYPTNATYVGINTLTAGTAQLSTNDIKSVSGTLRLTSGLNTNGQTFTNVGTMSPPSNQQISFTNGLNIPSGSLNMRFNNIYNAGTISWTTGLSTTASASATRNLFSVSIPPFVSGANANFVMNDLGVFSTKSVTLTTGGQITYPDTTTQNSGLIKGTRTLVAGTVTITDARVTAGAICVVSYADSSPVGGVLCAKVTAGQIIIESKLITDVSPVFFMYFI